MNNSHTQDSHPPRLEISDSASAFPILRNFESDGETQESKSPPSRKTREGWATLGDWLDGVAAFA